MSRVRDDARKNARHQFATTRADGTPVGSYRVTYQDGCSEAFDEHGDCFEATVGGPSHEPGSHTRENWWMRGPYQFNYDDPFDDTWSAGDA